MITDPPNKRHISYRPDIDGLRAIAVMIVVFFHAFPLKLPGGFAGVDIFFVISGFLISSIIFKNLDNGTFSFSDFYLRRVKRIFPALLLVMFFSMFVGFLLLSPDEFNELGKHIVGGLGFISNFVLWNEAGYFDASADLKPLLHFWSLGIEEQFYIIWPLLLFIFWKLRSGIFFFIASIIAISFFINVYYINQYPVFVFYLPPARFWELACGSMLAWIGFCINSEKNTNGYLKFILENFNKNNILYSNILSFIGFSFLICAIVFLNGKSVFPGYWALLPVLGAVLIIAGKNSILNTKILSSKIMVWFGLISFPLYLWHWPILSFARIFYNKIPPTGFRIIAVVLSILLAWLTMKYIEKPIRYSKKLVKFYLLIFLYFVCFCLGFFVYRHDFMESRVFKAFSVQRKGFEYAYGPSLFWYKGQDGWLFLGNAFEKVVVKLKMAEHPSDQKINETYDLFLKVAEAGKRNNVKVVFMMGPNKTSVYPEYLPKELVPSRERYADYFLNRIKSIDGLEVYDPTFDLQNAKKTEGLLYWRTDTHWNEKGAFFAFSGLMKRLGIPELDVRFKDGPVRSGDLITISKLKNFPLRRGDNWEAVWPEKKTWIETNTGGTKETPFGPTSVSINARPLSDKHIWVTGDSFSYFLRPYFDATFKEVRYIGHWSDKLQELPSDLDHAQEKPDMVVIERVERFF